MAQAQQQQKPPSDPPKVSIAINFKDLSFDMQEQVSQAMGFNPQGSPTMPQASSGGSASPPPQAPHIRVGQPNPHATGPHVQSISAGTEKAQAAQQIAGQLQKAYPTTSVQARAQSL